MKRSKIVFMALAGSVLFTALTAGAATTFAAQKHPANSQVALKGTVVSVDAIGNTLIIKSPKTLDTLDVDTATVILAKGKKIKLGDLSIDIPVALTYKIVDGKKIAMKIREQTAAVQSKTAPKDSTKSRSK